MEQLTPHQEAQIAHFADQLSQVQTINDLFPPDAGVFARLPETNPKPPLCDQLCLAAVYDLAAARRKREPLLQAAGNLLMRIDALTSA